MRKFISIIFILFCPFSLWAEMPKDGRIAISSEKMTVKGQEDKVLFEGAVIIQKGDVKITAGRAEVLIAGKEPSGAPPAGSVPPFPIADLASGEGKEIVQIEMMEKVEVRQGDRRILAQNGIYNAKEGEIVLTGNPEMWEKGYHVKGRLIRFSLTNKRSFVEGSVLTIY